MQFAQIARLMRFWQSILVMLSLALAGCGGPGAGSSSSSGGSGGSGNTGTEAISVTISSASVAPGSPATVTATLTKGGSPVAQEVISFTTDANLGVFSPATATALTDASGKATITLSAGAQTGAGTVTAKSRLGASGTVNYLSSGTGGNITLSLGAISFGTAPLSAYGTTSVSVNVQANGSPYQTPVDVTFASTCAASGKAILTPKVTTVNGVASAQYKDNGCNGTDTVTASLVGVNTASASLVVLSPSIGSIQFVSATPTTIALKGTGGAGQSETSLVKFKIVDQAGNPIKADVTFSLSTTVGGLSLTAAKAISDATTGEVSTNVQSGTVATPVRVLATVTTQSGVISTQSDKLSISTGLPDQAHFSLSASAYNIEGWNYDGTTATLTIRLADHFSNPVPDGTVVNFVAQGSSVQPSCQTSGGVCSVVFTSQELRPTNGRVAVLAYAIGEESFVDLDGDGLVSLQREFFDANGKSGDLPEAFLDVNETGVYASNDLFIDFNHNGTYDGPDNAYNGVLCKTGGEVTCNTQKSLHVFRNIEMVLSGSTVVTTNMVTLPTGKTLSSGAYGLDLGGCGGAQAIQVWLRDVNDNILPAGTTVTLSTDNGSAVGPWSYTIPSTNAKRSSTPDATFYIRGDGKLESGVCTDTTGAGTLSINVTSPKGVKSTSYAISLAN
ncbi:hypothetical protein KSF73_02780 [Burkholderiaceae bacterium DAT-1]|nr:hypothetical protein [Burkholderiaceae bacterium DAT-1]